ncbi:MAG: hypothetical protein Q9187_001757 [Circinaria calcarea]
MGDAFSVAGSAVGMISLGVTVCQSLLQYYNSWKDSQKDIAAMYSSLEGLTKTFRLLETAIGDRTFNKEIVVRITQSLASCDTGLEILKKKLAKVETTQVNDLEARVRAHVRRALYPFKESTLMKLRETISDLRDNLSLAVNILHIDISSMSLKKIESINGQIDFLIDSSISMTKEITDNLTKIQLTQIGNEEQLKDHKRTSVLHWISPLNFGAKQSDLSNQRQEGTGDWLLNSSEFANWLNGATRTLWCPGMPGAGKTILASKAIDYIGRDITKRDVGIAYIYCNYKDVSQTGTGFVASLLQQLLQQRPETPPEVTALYEQHSPRNTTPSLSEYARVLQQQVLCFSDVYLIIDALDECPDNARSEVLDEINRLPSNIHFLATSRHIPTIERRFRDAPRLEVKARDEDIMTYLTSWIDGKDACGGLISADPTLRDSVISTITKKADGMFLLAELYKNLLQGEDNRRDLLKTLQSLPIGLNDTYDQAMLRIETQGQRQVKRAKQVLSWIVFAERALTIEQLQCALAIEPGDTSLDKDALPDEHLMVSVCAGLVVIDRKNNIIRLVHYTAMEYFKSTRTTRFPYADRNIAATCLTYLSFEKFAEEECLLNLRTFRELKESYVLLDYASQQWGNHARKAFRRGQDITTPILEFFKYPQNVSFSVWVAYDLQGLVDYSHFQTFPRDIPVLHVVAFFGLDEMAIVMLDKGSEVDKTDFLGFTALHRAALKGRATTVQLLLSRGANIGRRDRMGRTALYSAVVSRNDEVVKIILEHGRHTGNIDKSNMPNASHIFWACDVTILKIVQMLVDYITDVHEKNGYLIDMLNAAVYFGNKEIVKLSLEQCTDSETIKHISSSLLSETAGKSNTKILQMLLKQGIPVQTKDQILALVLKEAVLGGSVSAVGILLETGANPNLSLPNETPALIYAAQEGKMDVVQLLVDKGADLGMKDNRTGLTALQCAVLGGHEAVVRLLSEQGNLANEVIEPLLALTSLYRSVFWEDETEIDQVLANPIWLDVKVGQDFLRLHTAAKMGKDKVVTLLLGLGADIEAKDFSGHTALHTAARQGQDKVVKLLLDIGADIEARVGFLRDADGSVGADAVGVGCTALHLAARNGRDGTAHVLLSCGANFEATDDRGRTALIHALSSHAAAEKLLLKERAKIDTIDNDRWTTLLHTAQDGHAAVIQLLLKEGAKIDATDNDGWTALIHAADGGNAAVIQRLLEEGANLGIQSQLGMTAFLHAVNKFENNNTSGIQLLLDRGCDIEATNADGKTALSLAASRGLPNLIRWLFEKGAQIEAREQDGATPLANAVRNGHQEIVQILLELGADPNAVDSSITPSHTRVYQDDFDEALAMVRKAQLEAGC